ADRILAVASADATASCEEIVALLVKDQVLPASLRVAIARKWFAAAALSCSANGRSRKGNAANARGSRATERPAPLKSDRGAANATPQSTTNLAMLPVLLSIVQDSATLAAERRKAASEIAQYFLPKKPSQKKSKRGRFAADQYGFVVDPNEARELRDSLLHLACLPLARKRSPYAVAQKATKLQARISAIRQSLQCPCPSK